MKYILSLIILAGLGVAIITAQERALVEIGTDNIIEFERKPREKVPARMLPVVDIPAPAITDTQARSRTTYVSNDVVYRAWIVRDLTSEEITARDSRYALRDRQTNRRQQIENRRAQLQTLSTNYLARPDMTTGAEVIAWANQVNDHLGLLFGHEAQILKLQFGEE